LISCEQKQPVIPYFFPLANQTPVIPTEPESTDETEVEEPTEEAEPTPTWYRLGWVYLLGDRSQIIYEAEIDEWNIQAFKSQAELMNFFKDPNCPCSVVWFIN